MALNLEGDKTSINLEMNTKNISFQIHKMLSPLKFFFGHCALVIDKCDYLYNFPLASCSKENSSLDLLCAGHVRNTAWRHENPERKYKVQACAGRVSNLGEQDNPQNCHTLLWLTTNQ